MESSLTVSEETQRAVLFGKGMNGGDESKQLRLEVKVKVRINRLSEGEGWKLFKSECDKNECQGHCINDNNAGCSNQQWRTSAEERKDLDP